MGNKYQSIWEAQIPKIYFQDVILMCLAIALVVAPARAESEGTSILEDAERGAYSAKGLYDPTIIRYDNGLTLIAKRRPGVPTISARVSVGLGMAHYPCGQQHTPHFLEHMLFASVPGISEADFERRMFEYGAWTNARTQGTRTVYELDVYSRTATAALDLFTDVITNAELSKDSFRDTRKIIWREMGGTPGEVEQKTFLGGDLASGITKAGADLSKRHFRACGARHAGQKVAFKAVREAYRQHYVPERMVWTVVGDFDREQLLSWAANRLGEIPAGNADPPETPRVSDFEQAEYTGFASEPGVWILSPTNGLKGKTYYVEQFLAHLLDEQLYRRLRLESALTYTPGAYSESGSNWGVFGIHAETPTESHGAALKIMREIIQELTAAPLPSDQFRTVQLSLLRQWSQLVETNTDYAEHYIASLPQFERDGRFINDEVQIAALTPERVHEVAKRLFAPDRTAIVRDGDIQSEISARGSRD